MCVGGSITAKTITVGRAAVCLLARCTQRCVCVRCFVRSELQSPTVTRCLPARPWLETLEEYRTRLKAAVAEINATHDVDSLCKELPARVAQLILAEGGRLAK